MPEGEPGSAIASGYSVRSPAITQLERSVGDPMQPRTTVAILFGGRSSEHDVSLLSAANVVRAIDNAKYDVLLIGVTRQGEWLLLDLDGDGLPSSVPDTGKQVVLLPGGGGRLVVVPTDGPTYELASVDVVFPVLHGLDGEDGSVQGVAQIAGVPLVGCGILASAAALDKDAAKRLLQAAGLPVTRSVTVRWSDAVSFDAITNELGRPLFVKPARQGSSVGVSKTNSEDEFKAALTEAFKYDSKVLIEEFVQGREIECGVLELADRTVTVSVPGEIIPASKHGFYNYEAKYLDVDGATLSVPAKLPCERISHIQDLASRAFHSLGCEGMARIDFFVRPDMSAVINEVNTIPGFTNISMYPKMFEASGISYPKLIDGLIQHALARTCLTDSVRQRGPNSVPA